MEKLEFVVDEQYENEKGLFTVISIHREDMVIRWESGEEMRTPIELQRNIQKRRLWEKLQAEAEAAAAKNKNKSGKGQGFSGFKTTDFKVSAAKTNWRGRNRLGGEINRLLPDDNYNFNSWAYSTKSELHWQDTARRKRDPDGIGARFFIRLTPQSLVCGFCVTRPAEHGNSAREWASFYEWLTHDENEQNLRELAEKYELAVFDHNRPAKDGMRPAQKGWSNGKSKKEESVETISDFIDNAPETAAYQLEVAKSMDKIQAIAQGKAIAEDIAELFTALMPLYRAAGL